MVIIPRFVLLLTVILFGAHTEANDLPPPPNGYTWKHATSLKAAFLLPDGWHFIKDSKVDTVAYFISKEEISDTSSYETGVSINAFIGDHSAPTKLAEIFRSAANMHSATIEKNEQEPFILINTQYDSDRPNNLSTVRVYMLGIVNSLTKSTYMVIFESPVNEWDAQWRHGKIILDSLALESDI